MVKARTNTALHFILLILFIAGCEKKEKITPEIKPITESVYASGYAKAAGQYQVYSNVNGIIEKVHVQEGDSVKKGTALFTIEKTLSELSTEDARLAVHQAEEDLKDIEDIRRNTLVAKENYLQDSLMYERYKKLRAQNAVSGVNFEEQKLRYENSRKTYFNAINDFNQAKSQLNLQYERAKTNLKLSQETEDEYVISSTIEGKVYNVIPREGEGVNTQTLLAIVGKSDSFLLELEVDENDLAKIRLGQEIFITIDSYENRVFQAVISKIDPILDESTGTFTIEGTFVNTPPRLYPNVSVEANILIAQKDSALLIPREYLIDETYVLTEPDKKVKVKVGLKNYEYAEILNGLKKDQYIYKP